MDQIFLLCKPSVPCFHEMDPDSLFSSFGAIARPKKTTTLDPFCCSKALCKCIFVQYYLLHVSLPCSVVVLRMCTIALFNHKPNLIVTSVNV